MSRYSYAPMLERNPRPGAELTMPHRESEPKPAWWVAPACFVIVGAFGCAAILGWWVQA